MIRGIDGKHPHFQTYNTLGGDVAKLHRNFSLPDKHPDQLASADLTDPAGHGTHVAGIIAGGLINPMSLGKDPTYFVGECITNTDKPDGGPPLQIELSTQVRKRDVSDATRLAGVAPRCKLISLRIEADNGENLSFERRAVLQYVREELNGNGKIPRVHGVNLSLGYEFNPQWFACGQSPICVEVNRLVRSGVVVVVAAGNTGYGSLMADQRITRTGMALTINDPGNSDLAITGRIHASQHAAHVRRILLLIEGPDRRRPPQARRRRSWRADHFVCRGQVSRKNERSARSDRSRDSMLHRQQRHQHGRPARFSPLAAFLSIRREFIGQPERVKEICLAAATPLGRERYFEGNGLFDLMRMIQSGARRGSDWAGPPAEARNSLLLTDPVQHATHTCGMDTRRFH